MVLSAHYVCSQATICLRMGVPGSKELLYLDVQKVHRLESQATGNFQEDPMPRIFRTIQIIPQVLWDTLR